MDDYTIRVEMIWKIYKLLTEVWVQEKALINSKVLMTEAEWLEGVLWMSSSGMNNYSNEDTLLIRMLRADRSILLLAGIPPLSLDL